MTTKKKWALWQVGALAIALILLCLFLIDIGCAEENVTVNVTPTATWTPAVKVIWAEPADNMQPTVVYYGEIVNVFNMIGWADEKGNYMMDYWYYNHSCGYRRADLVIDITRPRAVPVNRVTFPYQGVYYQHQIEGESGCSPIIEVREGVRMENATEEKMHQENVTTAVVYDPWPELKEKYSGYDILQARYQPLNLTETGADWLWVFHTQENIYLLQNGNWDNVSTASFKPGRYSVILQWTGNSTPIGVYWYPHKKAISCACLEPKRVQEPVDLAAYWRTDLLFALANEKCSDDLWVDRDMVVQEPAADISDIFEMQNSTEGTVLYVQGYTNLAAGTMVNLTIDRPRWDYHELRRHTFEATVYTGSNATGPGFYRKFRVKIPYDPDELRGGKHTLDVVTPFNTVTSVDFWVYELPEGQERPPAYLKYIDRNLWVPTPTPEVVRERVEVPGPTQIVERTVTITPNQSQLNEAAYGAAARVAVDWVVVALGYLCSVVYRVWRKGKW